MSDDVKQSGFDRASPESLEAIRLKVDALVAAEAHLERVRRALRETEEKIEASSRRAAFDARCEAARALGEPVPEGAPSPGAQGYVDRAALEAAAKGLAGREQEADFDVKRARDAVRSEVARAVAACARGAVSAYREAAAELQQRWVEVVAFHKLLGEVARRGENPMLVGDNAELTIPAPVGAEGAIWNGIIATNVYPGTNQDAVVNQAAAVAAEIKQRLHSANAWLFKPDGWPEAHFSGRRLS